MKKRFPKSPFEYGKYIIEYREQKNGILRFHKEKIETFEEAQKVRERLIQIGYHDPVIRSIG